MVRFYRDRQFFCGSSLGYTSIESCQLAGLKYAIFSSTGRKTKKLPHLKLFLWMVFQHGLLEGSTILLQYSAISRTPLESSRLGELKCAISPGYDVRPKNKSIRKCKKWLRDGRTWSLYCGLVQTSSDKFGQVRTRVKRYFSSTVSRTLSNLAHLPNLCSVF